MPDQMSVISYIHNMTNKIEFLQINLQKAKQAQIEIGQKIRSFNKSSSSFVCLVQEPQIYNSRLAGQPKI